MEKGTIARIVLAFCISSAVLGNGTALAWSGDTPSVPPTTVMGTADQCKTAQEALKKDFEAHIEELNEPDPEYQKVSDEIDAYRENMRDKKRFKKTHEDAMTQEADLDEKVIQAFIAKIDATYDFIDRLCSTDANTVLLLQQKYYKTRYELFSQHVEYLTWIKKNWRVFQYTLPKSGKARYQKWTRNLRNVQKISDTYKSLLENINKETAQTLFTSPVEYPISAS